MINQQLFSPQTDSPKPLTDVYCDVIFKSVWELNYDEESHALGSDIFSHKA